jgi:hypothetical protein
VIVFHIFHFWSKSEFRENRATKNSRVYETLNHDKSSMTSILQTHDCHNIAEEKFGHDPKLGIGIAQRQAKDFNQLNLVLLNK